MTALGLKMMSQLIKNHPEADNEKEVIDSLSGYDEKILGRMEERLLECNACRYGECDKYSHLEWNVGKQPVFQGKEIIWADCAKRKKYNFQQNLLAHGLGVRYLDCCFENYYSQNKNQEKALALCQQFCSSKKEDLPIGASIDASIGATINGLMISGPIGTGKTHLAAAIMQELWRRDISCAFGSAPGLLANIRNAIQKNDIRASDILHKFQVIGLAIIDDIGVEKVTDWVREQFYLLINARYEAMLPLVVTTNNSLEELEKHIGDRVVSRLIEICKGVILTGPDYRKSKLRNRS
jgi:DNA replication protein DnaC